MTSKIIETSSEKKARLSADRKIQRAEQKEKHPKVYQALLESRRAYGSKIRNNPEAYAALLESQRAYKAKIRNNPEDYDNKLSRQILSRPIKRGARSSAQDARNYAKMASRQAQEAQNAADIAKEAIPPARIFVRPASVPPGRTMAVESRRVATSIPATQADVIIPPSRGFVRPRLIPPGKTMAADSRRAWDSSQDAIKSAKDARNYAQYAREYANGAIASGIVADTTAMDAELKYNDDIDDAEQYELKAEMSAEYARRIARTARTEANAAEDTSEQLYDHIREIEREANMLAGGDKATLFDGEELGPDESKHDDDDIGPTIAGTMPAIERESVARSRPDSVDASDFKYNDGVIAGANIVPIGIKDPLESRSSRLSSDSSRLSSDSLNNNSYSGSRAALNANGFGMPIYPSVEQSSVGDEIKGYQDLRGGPDSNDAPIPDEALALRAQRMNRQRVQDPNFRANNKWNPTIGRGNKLVLSTAPNSLQVIRDAQIKYNQPGRTRRGDAVNLVRLGNQTSNKILNQYQP